MNKHAVPFESPSSEIQKQLEIAEENVIQNASSIYKECYE